MALADTPPRVVVADDSALMRRVVASILRRGGVEVVGSAQDGDEALTLCARERPDVMTLDLSMPGLGGIDVLRALREPGRPPVPVVVVSAFSPSSGARAVDALAEGAFELVTKPTGAEDEVDGFAQNLLAKVAAGRGSAPAPSCAAAATIAWAPRSRAPRAPGPPRGLVAGAADRQLHRRPPRAGRAAPRSSPPRWGSAR